MHYSECASNTNFEKQEQTIYRKQRHQHIVEVQRNLETILAENVIHFFKKINFTEIRP